MRRVRNTALLLLIVAIGMVSSPLFGQNAQGTRPQNPTAPVLQGKNVTVYLEDAEFGIFTEKFAYDPKAKLVDIQNEDRNSKLQNPQSTGNANARKHWEYNLAPISTANFVNVNSSPFQPAQSTLPKKIVPRPLGTNSPPKPRLEKPQNPANGTPSIQEELSFATIDRIQLL